MLIALLDNKLQEIVVESTKNKDPMEHITIATLNMKCYKFSILKHKDGIPIDYRILFIDYLGIEEKLIKQTIQDKFTLGLQNIMNKSNMIADTSDKELNTNVYPKVSRVVINIFYGKVININ